MIASYQKYILQFKQASGTSRGILRTKETYFLKLEAQGKTGIGECAIRGLSADDRPDYEDKLKWLCENISLNFENLVQNLSDFPSILFGLEQALLSFKSLNSYELFPSKFTSSEDSIGINGLIWMGSETFMKNQLKEKIQAGFSTLKMKIGAIDFETELSILKSIRDEFSAEKIELRVDANGAFAPNEALEKLKRLSDFEIHSIEQPIRQGQLNEMAELCLKTPIPIALDEELIGIFEGKKKRDLLDQIKPQFIILKPSLLGGFKKCAEWIQLAEQRQIGWWITSALESNIGLNAIAQWTYTLNTKMPQGLGTGGLFTNNFECPLEVKSGRLQYTKNKAWRVNL